MAGKKVVLVVEQDPELRDSMGRWLEEAGFEVLACPGPSSPDYTCVAGRGHPCALALSADAVVLDLWLASDSVLAGTSSIELLNYYLSSGKPVLGLSAKSDHMRLVKLFLEDPLVLLEWPPERRDLCETVRAVLGGKGDLRTVRGAPSPLPAVAAGHRRLPIRPLRADRH